MPSAQALPFILPHIFSFIIFTASSALLLSSKYNVSISMGVTPGFPYMGPLSIYIKYFTISATDFYPSF